MTDVRREVFPAHHDERSKESFEILLAEARAAGPARIEYRDRLASYGILAVAAMREWLDVPDLAAVAVRVLGRISKPATAKAVAILVATAHNAVAASIRGDAEEELVRMRFGKRLLSSSDFVMLEKGTDPSGRDFVRFRTRAMESGNFTLLDPVMRALRLRTNPKVDLEVTCRARTIAVTSKLESNNEVYPRL